jgi:hypothetical protein
VCFQTSWSHLGLTNNLYWRQLAIKKCHFFKNNFVNPISNNPKLCFQNKTNCRNEQTERHIKTERYCVSRLCFELTHQVTNWKRCRWTAYYRSLKMSCPATASKFLMVYINNKSAVWKYVPWEMFLLLV